MREQQLTSRRRGHGPFWLLFAARILAATAITAIVWVICGRTVIAPGTTQSTFDAVLFGFWIVPMLWVGLIALAWQDMKSRCRHCGSRLRMPLAEGSYAALLLDSPFTEYVCPFGHGRLRVSGWSRAGRVSQWETMGSIWDELLTGARNN